MLSQYGRYNFKYDASGLRYSKTTNDSSTYYYYDGDRLIGEDCLYGRIRYMYDHKEIVGARFFPSNGSMVEYEYIKDATGSVIAILKDSTIVAQYTYDAWGNIINQNINYSDVFAQINPIRYKGYYFDRETGLYYLQSRYYSPEIGAFISPDSVSFLDYQNIGGLNLYSYCKNNPIMYSDSTGHFWDYILDGFFIFLGIKDFIEDPSWSKAGWLALDIGLAILPIIPALSSTRHLNKIDDVVDLTKTYGYIDDFADAGGVIRKANKADFAGDGWNMVQGLSKTDDGFTISNHLIGTDIHKTFMNGGKTINRFNKVDGIDDTLKIIYELKPYNKRSIRKGIKQLYRYQNAVFEEIGYIYKMVLVVY